MSLNRHPSRLIGRDAEVASLSALVDGARSGASGALVLTGPAGVGKTSLIRAALADRARFELVFVDGIEIESGLAYSGLHRTLARFLPVAHPLPDPQLMALDTVFGIRAGATPEPFLIGLASLTVLTDVARHTPLLVVIDDAQWIDQSSLLVLACSAAAPGRSHRPAVQWAERCGRTVAARRDSRDAPSPARSAGPDGTARAADGSHPSGARTADR
jgi:hypothetical protein